MWKWSAGLLVAAVLVLSWSPTRTDDTPEPGPDPVVENLYDRAFRVEAELNRDIRKAAAAKLRAGEFATDREVNEYLTEESMLAEDAAWQPVKDMEADALNDGKWTAELHAAILEGGDGSEADDGEE